MYEFTRPVIEFCYSFETLIGTDSVHVELDPEQQKAFDSIQQTQHLRDGNGLQRLVKQYSKQRYIIM